jgi:isoleucyl-tRNA synthetase
VHLTDWPSLVDGTADAAALPADPSLVAAMDRVREICSVTLGLRKARSLRVRQPLAKLVVVDADPAALAPFESVIAGEVNVKELVLAPLSEDAAARHGISQRLDVNARAAGPRLGRQVQAAIKAAKAGDWTEDAAGQVTVLTPDGPIALQDGEYTKRTVVDEAAGGDRAAAVLSDGGFVVLDTALTPELEAEGYARDLVRLVQDERKARGLDVSDRIDLALAVPAGRVAAVEAHRDLIAAETLALALDVTATDAGEATATVTKR